MKKLIAFILSIAVLCGVGTYCYTRLMPQKVVPEIATNDIEGIINDIGELATAEYVYKICQTMTKDGLKVPIFDYTLTYSKIIYSYEGTIKAGVQFGNIRIDVQDNNDVTNIFVHLPEIQIFSNELKNDSLEVYDEKRSIFNMISFSDVNLSQMELKEAARKSAIDSGLLEQAKENAETVIRSTILSFFEADKCNIQFY